MPGPRRTALMRTGTRAKTRLAAMLFTLSSLLTMTLASTSLRRWRGQDVSPVWTPDSGPRDRGHAGIGRRGVISVCVFVEAIMGVNQAPLNEHCTGFVKILTIDAQMLSLFTQPDLYEFLKNIPQLLV